MGLEQRGNKFYFYKKEREGGKVVSRYAGGGESAELFSMFDELEADRKADERFKKQLEREKAERFESELTEIEAAFTNLMTAYLLVNGYRQTASREWRKKRNGGK